MNEIVIEELSSELNIKINQIKAVLTLLEEGSTIPFIARYRKEATGALDENQITKIEEKYRYYNNLMERKETVIRLIDEKGMLTDEIKKNILNCTKLVEVEDIYLPYKEKKKTKATEAIKMGLEPLAKAIMAFPTKGSLESLCGIVPNVEKEVALENTKYIISEWISDNAYYRKFVRNYIWNNASIISKIKKNAVDEKKTYEIYYDFTEKVKYIKPYRVLAINRAEKENVISVKLDYDNDYIFNSLSNKIIKNKESFVVDYVNDVIKDALKRLIYPSIERDVRSELTEKSEDNAIEVFKDNLENLLMTRPVKGYRVLGFDPAFRTGCKLACLDEKGNVLHKDVIYPHEPKNEKEASRIKLLNLIKTYNINLIAIGNGTASRESEEFVANTIKDLKDVYYTIVSEAGASVYSASKEAQREFPDYEVQERSAVSIGRRVIDPLSELVKIDPKSIGVGEYQHDVNSKKLTESLDNTVSKVVNEVGVNINTASNFILKYVSGLTTTVINKIQKFKEKKEFTSREEIKKLTTDKVYEQCVGFLRINNSINPLDNTGIHPESYELTSKLLKLLNLDIKDTKTEEFKHKLENIDLEKLTKELNSDIYTVTDIIKELKNPGLDPRSEAPETILRSDVLTIDDLSIGMELKGTVRNVASFGAFVDIGLHDDGLLHISKMSKNFVKDPKDIVSVGDILTVYISDIDKNKGKVQLSLIK
ncbi:MAG: RNA-binding transcriptional accessory protein [Tenericutes bacterium]|nr:RNA-binding transcriptional accessory protein [Mycoplasmatota bacterium]